VNEYDEKREEVARWGFYIWKDAKSTEIDNWDDVTWENVPESHKVEYRKGVDRLLEDGLAVQAKDQSAPVPSIDHFSWCDWTAEDAYAQAQNDMIQSNFRRIVEKPE